MGCTRGAGLWVGGTACSIRPPSAPSWDGNELGTGWTEVPGTGTLAADVASQECQDGLFGENSHFPSAVPAGKQDGDSRWAAGGRRFSPAHVPHFGSAVPSPGEGVCAGLFAPCPTNTAVIWRSRAWGGHRTAPQHTRGVPAALLARGPHRDAGRLLPRGCPVPLGAGRTAAELVRRRCGISPNCLHFDVRNLLPEGYSLPAANLCLASGC